MRTRTRRTRRRRRRSRHANNSVAISQTILLTQFVFSTRFSISDLYFQDDSFTKIKTNHPFFIHFVVLRSRRFLDICLYFDHVSTRSSTDKKQTKVSTERLLNTLAGKTCRDCHVQWDPAYFDWLSSGHAQHDW